MNTLSMIVRPSTILFQPHVGRFHASEGKILILKIPKDTIIKSFQNHYVQNEEPFYDNN